MTAPLVTKIGAMNVGGAIATLSFTVGSESGSTINVAMVAKDSDGNALERVIALPWFLSTTTTGTIIDAPMSVAPVIGTDGLLMDALGALTASQLTDSTTGSPITTIAEVVDVIATTGSAITATTASSLGDATNGGLALSTAGGNTYADAGTNTGVNTQLDTVADSVIASADAAIDVTTGLIEANVDTQIDTTAGLLVTNFNTAIATIGDNFSSLAVMINKLTADMLSRNDDNKVRGVVVFESNGQADINFEDVGTGTAYLCVLLPSGALAVSGAITHT